MSDKRKALEEVFDMFDSDKSGKIDSKELKGALREYYKYINEPVDDAKLDAEVNEIIKMCDACAGGKADGKIDKAEWFKFFDE